MDNWVVALCQNFKQISWEIRQTSVVSFSLPSSSWKAKAVLLLAGLDLHSACAWPSWFISRSDREAGLCGVAKSAWQQSPEFTFCNVFDLLTPRWLQLFIVFEMSGIVWLVYGQNSWPPPTCYTPTPSPTPPPPTLHNICRELLALFMI